MKNLVALAVAVLSLVALSGCAGSMPDAKYVALEKRCMKLEKELEAKKAEATAAADETEGSDEGSEGAATVVVPEVQGFIAKPRNCDPGHLLKLEGDKTKFTVMQIDGRPLAVYSGPNKLSDVIAPKANIWVCFVDDPYAEPGVHTFSGSYYTRWLDGVVDLDAPSGTFHFTGGYSTEINDFHLIQLGKGWASVNVP